MEIKVPIEDLRKRSLFVATPMYGGMCGGGYAQSMINLSVACAQHGIPMSTYFLFNESLITRARNYATDAFLRSECTHMLFIDADITFEVDAVLTLLALQSDESPYDVIAAPYPKKSISWEKIKQAVDLGVADENPNNLEKYVGDYVFNLKSQTTHIRLDEPVEVLETGTGFMMIRRKSFEKFAAAYPELSYKPDHVRSEDFDGSREIMTYFDCIIDPVSKRYLSEDYMFCHKLRECGGTVWLCPWIPLKHMGTYMFGGSLPDIASIGASLTADTSKIRPKNNLNSNIKKVKKRTHNIS